MQYGRIQSVNAVSSLRGLPLQEGPKSATQMKTRTDIVLTRRQATGEQRGICGEVEEAETHWPLSFARSLATPLLFLNTLHNFPRIHDNSRVDTASFHTRIFVSGLFESYTPG